MATYGRLMLDVIDTVRLASGVSIPELSRRSGIPLSTTYRMLARGQRLSITRAVQLCVALELPLDECFREADERRNGTPTST